MSDTNDMRREFEAWYSQTFDDQCVWDEARNCYVEIGCHLAWKGWQAATERATALERGRCSSVQEPSAWMTQSGALMGPSADVTKNGALYGWTPLFAAPQPAIRQGGDT